MRKNYIHFVVSLVLLFCIGCKADIEDVTADNFRDLLERPEYSKEVSLEQFGEMARCFTDQVLQMNPKQFANLDNIGKETYDSYGHVTYRNEGYFTVINDLNRTNIKDRKELGISDNRNGDGYDYSFTGDDASILWHFHLIYNVNDPNHVQRFNESLNCALTKYGAVYKPTTLKYGNDIIVEPVGDYYVIGVITKTKEDSPFFVDFYMFSKRKKDIF